jgi:hypothetical protein
VLAEAVIANWQDFMVELTESQIKRLNREIGTSFKVNNNAFKLSLLISLVVISFISSSLFWAGEIRYDKGPV